MLIEELLFAAIFHYLANQDNGTGIVSCMFGSVQLVLVCYNVFDVMYEDDFYSIHNFSMMEANDCGINTQSLIVVK